MKNGFFITFEGSDGCGKSTQSLLLVKKLKQNSFDVVRTREPGGTVVAETLRKILLDPKSRISPLAELFLYEAGRAQHTEEIVLPALRKGRVVICERYADATVAYQGFGRGLDIKMIMNLNKMATEGLDPDLTVYLDEDVRVGLARAGKRGKDRLEKENLLFHKRVRGGYIWLTKKFPKRFVRIDANGSIQEISKRIFDAVIAKIK